MANSAVLALVGMPGSGKSEVASFFRNKGFPVVRFGDMTDIELSERGLPRNEENERLIRELLRKNHGMAAYAKLSIPRMNNALENSKIVIADGLYSWEEYLLLKDYYKEKLIVIAIHASPNTRYERLSKRPQRPLTSFFSSSRDKAEIENLNKGGPISMANFIIDNNGTIEDLHAQLEKISKNLGLESIQSFQNG